MVKYFLKDGKLHKYPLPKNCDVTYSDEELYDDPPKGMSDSACGKCFTFPPSLGKE
jgi:hypothetical protein